jgi:hypothetical protein
MKLVVFALFATALAFTMPHEIIRQFMDPTPPMLPDAWDARMDYDPPQPSIENL